MVANTKKISYVVAVLTIVSMLLASAPVFAAGDDIWSDRPAKGSGHRQGQKMTAERVDKMLERIAQKNPKRADELKQLRQDDPEKLRAEIRKMARRRTGGKQMQKGRGKQGWDLSAKGRKGRGKGGHPGGRMREQMQQKHEEFTKWLQENYPDTAQAIAKFRDKNPKVYFKKIMWARKQYGPIMEAQKYNPELADVLQEELELKNSRNELLKQLKGAADQDKEDLIAQLEQVVSQRFDLIVRKKQLKYEDLREKLEKLQQEVANRQIELDKLQYQKSQAVDARLEELISDTEKVKWD